MNADVTFALEKAPWPALLVESPGIIRRANRAAASLLGARIKSGECPLACIWSEANPMMPEELLLHAFDTEAVCLEIQLRLKDGLGDTLPTFICPAESNGRRYFLVQFFKGIAAIPNPAFRPSNTPAAPAPMQGTPWPSPSAPGSASPHIGTSGPPPPPQNRDTASSDPDATSDAGTTQKLKMDSALQLTRTVALDFNNALTSILGHTSLLLGKMEASHPWRNSLLEVEKAASKAAEIAHDLAEFGRQDKTASPSHAEGNLNDLLRRSVELFKSQAGAGVEWKLHLEGKLCAARFDEAKIQQAIVKVLENAVQAVGPTGRILVFSRNRELEETVVDGTARLAPGTYVCVEISDTGAGIAPEVLPRVFEPFFTTKRGHRGLGLALVYGIVTNHGGSVAVSSAPGRGTTVRIYLPATRKLIRDKSYKDDDLRGHETILIVDDEDLLLTMGRMILSSYGYKVLTANDGRKAMELMSDAVTPVDLVLTDLVMPNMSGRELIEHLKVIAPEVPIICMTGYVHPGAKSAENFLQKPFTSQSLLAKVKETLNMASTS